MNDLENSNVENMLFLEIIGWDIFWKKSILSLMFAVSKLDYICFLIRMIKFDNFY